MPRNWTTIVDPSRTKCGEQLPSAESCSEGFEERPLDGMTRAGSQARVIRLAEELKPEPTRQHGTRSDSKLVGVMPRDRSPCQYRRVEMQLCLLINAVALGPDATTRPLGVRRLG